MSAAAAASSSASASAGDAPAAVPVGELSYTEASRELDAIVDFFEQREVDVDVLVTRLEGASALIDELDKRLRRTRAQVEELVPRSESVSGDGGGAAAGRGAGRETTTMSEAGTLPEADERLYFRQLLAGRDFADGDMMARQMVNFVYLVGDRSTGEAVVVDPAYAMRELFDIVAADDMRRDRGPRHALPSRSCRRLRWPATTLQGIARAARAGRRSRSTCRPTKRRGSPG